MPFLFFRRMPSFSLTIAIFPLIVASLCFVHSEVLIEDEFAEFEDPDDTSTIDLSEPLTSIVNLTRHAPYSKKDRSESLNSPSSKDGFTENEIILDSDKVMNNDFPPMDEDVFEEFEGILEANVLRGAKQKPSQQTDDDVMPKSERRANGKKDTQRTLRTSSHDSKNGAKSDLKIIKVPHHLTHSWDNFHLELMVLAGLLVYFFNFLYGRGKNAKIANYWFSAHRILLEANFSLVGDDGQLQVSNSNQCPLKESDHIYLLWCSGRVFVEGMLLELRLLKRQCLVAMISQWLKPTYDTMVSKVVMDDCEMDGWVFALGRRRRLLGLQKDHADLATYCSGPPTPISSIGINIFSPSGATVYSGSSNIGGSGESGGNGGVSYSNAGSVSKTVNSSDNFCVLSEFSEVTAALLNPKFNRVLETFDDRIEYLYFSDQYSGPKQSQDDQSAVKPPITQKVLLFSFRIGNKGLVSQEDMEPITVLFQFILFIIDRVRKLRLSKEAKFKSERNRQRAHDLTLRQMLHNQRQEAAQSRKDEKRRAVKERIMAEEDPDKARKLEEREMRKEKSRKGPKMKMLKVKGM